MEFMLHPWLKRAFSLLPPWPNSKAPQWIKYILPATFGDESPRATIIDFSVLWMSVVCAVAIVVRDYMLVVVGLAPVLIISARMLFITFLRTWVIWRKLRRQKLTAPPVPSRSYPPSSRGKFDRPA